VQSSDEFPLLKTAVAVFSLCNRGSFRRFSIAQTDHDDAAFR